MLFFEIDICSLEAASPVIAFPLEAVLSLALCEIKILSKGLVTDFVAVLQNNFCPAITKEISFAVKVIDIQGWMD